MVKMSAGRLKPKAIIRLMDIEGLDGIRFHPEEGLTLGATARLAEVASHPDVLNHYPALAHAVQVMANVEVRHMATVAGNLCNAAPSADTAPPLIAMGAEVTLASLNGQRRLPLDQFFKGPGLTAMQHGEIMTSIHVPLPQPKSGASYMRISARCGVDIAAVGVGVMAVFNGKGLQRGQSCPRGRGAHSHACNKDRRSYEGSANGRKTSSKREGSWPPKKLNPSQM